MRSEDCGLGLVLGLEELILVLGFGVGLTLLLLAVCS